MDSEGVKAIVDAISGLGGNALSGFVTYMICWASVELGTAILTAGAILTGLWMLGRFAWAVVGELCASEKIRIASGARDLSGWVEDELVQFCTWVSAHKNEWRK